MKKQHCLEQPIALFGLNQNVSVLGKVEKAIQSSFISMIQSSNSRKDKFEGIWNLLVAAESSVHDRAC